MIIHLTAICAVALASSTCVVLLLRVFGQLSIAYQIDDPAAVDKWHFVFGWHPTGVADTPQRSQEDQRSPHEGPTVQAEKPQRSPIEEQAAMRRQVYAELLRPLVHMLDGFSPTSEAVLNPVEVFLVRRVLADYLGEAT